MSAGCPIQSEKWGASSEQSWRPPPDGLTGKTLAWARERASQQARLTVLGRRGGLREYVGLLLAGESLPKLSMPLSSISSTLKLCPCSLLCHSASIPLTTIGVDPGGGGAMRIGSIQRPTCLEAGAALARASLEAPSSFTLACCTQTPSEHLETAGVICKESHNP